MSEIVYTYNKYTLNERSAGEYIQYIGDVLLQDMRVQKYVSFCYTATTSGGSTTEYYYGGFVWNETTEGDVVTYKDVYFVTYGIKQSDSSSSNFVITNRHYYKCNTEGTGLKFKAKKDVVFGIVSPDETTTDGSKDKLIFGIDVTTATTGTEHWYFCIPPKSFFLEGDHQSFNDLKPGKYPLGAFYSNP